MNGKILTSFLIVGLILLIVGVVLVVSGCAQVGIPDDYSGTSNVSDNTPVVENPATPSAGAPQTSEEGVPKVLKIADILEEPENYQGQTIVVKGKIISECGSGCWFTLNDGTGTIYVDLAPSNLVIPQKRGASATVLGQVVQKGSDTYLIGTWVDLIGTWVEF